MSLLVTPFQLLLLLAGIGSLFLVGISLAAFLRRRTRSYLLIFLALTTVFARPVIAGLSVYGSLPDGIHHSLEHGLDVVMALLVIAAVYHARNVEKNTGDLEGGEPHG